MPQLEASFALCLFRPRRGPFGTVLRALLSPGLTSVRWQVSRPELSPRSDPALWYTLCAAPHQSRAQNFPPSGSLCLL